MTSLDTCNINVKMAICHIEHRQIRKSKLRYKLEQLRQYNYFRANVLNKKVLL